MQYIKSHNCSKLTKCVAQYYPFVSSVIPSGQNKKDNSEASCIFSKEEEKKIFWRW